MFQTVRMLAYLSSPLIEMGIRTFLRDYPTLNLAHITNDYHTLLHLSREYQPDIILFCTSPTMKSQIHYLQEYYQQKRAPILLLALAYDKDHCTQLLEAGVHGYLLFGVDDELLPSAIHTVAVGGRWFSPSIECDLFRRGMTSQAMPLDQASWREITDREKQIMQLLARGWSNQQIAQTLAVTERTVRFHVRNICDKLHFSTRAEVIVWMMKSRQA